jgi:biopolymer transport protein ExbB
MMTSADAMPLHELLAQGGWAMYPIYACSVLTVGVFLKKIFELRAARLHDVAWVEGVVEHALRGELDAAHRACRAIVHPASRVVSALVHALDEAPSQAEAEAKRVATLELTKLETGINLLSFLAQVSPLLGLLGTVLGMVEMFMGLQGAGDGNIAIGDLASGIWKALLTTAAGLTVAVPALAGYSYLGSRVDQVRLQIVDIVQRVTFAAGRAGGR